MKPFVHFGPFRAPHKTKGFWIYVAVIAASVISAPLLPSLLGLPPVSWHTWLTSGAITLLVFIPLGWGAFWFGRIGWLIVTAALFIFWLWARRHG
jgi:hypothetical protein